MLAQVNAFHVYDLVETHQFSFTKAVAELSVLLWIPEIRNLEEYLVSHWFTMFCQKSHSFQ